MGIAQFFSWFYENFGTHIKKIKNKKTIDVHIDNLLIDMNGLFHNACQKVYEYGNFKRKVRFLNYKKKPKNQTDVYIEICKNIEEIFQTVKPKKRLIMAVDGPAPKCKLVQQRQRRYKSVLDREEDSTDFDSNQLSPGTKLMDNIGKYIDWYIKKRMSEDIEWQKIEVIFSNEKSAGEGESKAMSIIRKFCHKDESYCLHGLDADLIMLSLGTHIENFYILRDNVFFDKDEEDKFLLVNIGHTALQLGHTMDWDGDNYNPSDAINDFVFLCYCLGNDFLPHIPGLEIIEGGIDTILKVYRDIGKFHGHITKINTDGSITFNKIPLKVFFEMISEYEKPVLEHKLKSKKTYFEDILLESCATYTENKYVLDIKKYRNEYCKKYFGTTSQPKLEKICHTYLQGLQFVLSYYTNSVPSWNWNYPHYYAPSAYLLSKFIDTYKYERIEKSKPLLPFQQLMYILPPKSFNLLPEPLDDLYNHKDLEEYYPDEFEIDLSGKKHDWQGIVLLPFVNLENIVRIHNSHYEMVDEKERKRNNLGKTFKYIYIPYYTSSLYRSYYGDIPNYKLRVILIDI